ncbi:hypothetical protein BHAOGJBA_4147 [Methylobacterium hispanicum]|uniref:Uncharacterized protein n=1 Tax=Methylobacterium hispanicum TaxID=270350 RepID=A0AAV4ZPY0_9HYPH|nr:hypothetical protein [Methylobacterium hispanicum]GJD90605.1 hypothetical protein BHAOGJBA_4147 [Methylobacterium hispanicum]
MRNPHLDDEDIASLPDFLRHLLADERQAAGPAYNRRAVRAPVEPLPSEMPPAAPVDARPVAQVRTVPTAPQVPTRRPVRMPDADPRRPSQGSLL